MPPTVQIVAIIVSLAVCLAALAPRNGVVGFLRNATLALVGLVMLLASGLLIGRILRVALDRR